MNNKIKIYLDKISKVIASKSFTIAASFFGLYLLSTGVSVLIFSFVLEKPLSESMTLSGIEANRSKINLDLPKTETCVINGAKFTKVEKEIWETRRPAVVMIENHADSRPPSGLSRADVVYEAVAEGGITRFAAVFYCGASAFDVKVAPVRSVRIYFIDFASEYGNDPLFMHVGGANNFSGSGDTARDVRALEFLETIGWRVPKGNDLDTTYDSGFPVFWRNYERLDRPVATEHTMMASLDAAFTEAQKREFGDKDSKGVAWDKNFVSWKFKDDKPSSSPAATNISFEFWSNKPDYDVEWKYDSANNQYLRFNGGKEHTDLETKEQLTAKDVVIMFVKERGPVDRNLHMYYTTIGTGKALIFQNGEVIEGTWEKSSRTARTKFYDEKGAEISFVRGPIWIEAVPAGNEINY
jgi:hypothetical protein